MWANGCLISATEIQQHSEKQHVVHYFNWAVCTYLITTKQMWQYKKTRLTKLTVGPKVSWQFYIRSLNVVWPIYCYLSFNSKYVTKYPIFDFVRELHVLKKAFGNKWLHDTTEIADGMQVHHAEHTRLVITNLKSLNGEVLSQASGTWICTSNSHKNDRLFPSTISENIIKFCSLKSLLLEEPGQW